MTDECSIDLTRAPFLRDMLGARARRALRSDQIERIRHRLRIIRSLMRVLSERPDADPARALWIIEKKKSEIDQILAETPIPGDGQAPSE